MVNAMPIKNKQANKQKNLERNVICNKFPLSPLQAIGICVCTKVWKDIYQHVSSGFTWFEGIRVM